MEKTFTIGELARAGEVATSAVRYYERAGLLKPAGRSEGNYRLYGREEMERLRFIRAAQSAGFTLEDIAALIQFSDGETPPCLEVEHLIEHRLTELHKRLKELRHIEKQLKTALKACKTADDKQRCEILEDLSISSKA